MSEESAIDALVGALDTDDAASEKPEQESPAPEAQQQEKPQPQEAAEEESDEEQQDDGLIELPLTEKDGTPVRVTLEQLQEWRENGLRLSDYTRQVQAAVEERKQFETLREQAVRERQTEAQNQIAQLNQLQEVVFAAIAPELQGVNWQQLAATDVTRYVQLQQRANYVREVLGMVSQQKAKIEQQLTQETEASRAKQAAEAKEVLQREIPNWNDQYYSDLCQFAINNGYDPNEVLSATDAKAFKVLHKAYQFDRLQAAKPAAQQKLQQLPKVIRPGAQPMREASTQKRLNDNRATLKKSGSVKDLARVLGDM